MTHFPRIRQVSPHMLVFWSFDKKLFTANPQSAIATLNTITQ